jgi:hypothetical protein
MEFCCVGVPWRGLRPALPRWRVPREVNTPHDLHDIPVIGFCTMLCGGEDCSDMAVFGCGNFYGFATVFRATTRSAGCSGCSIRRSSTGVSCASCKMPWASQGVIAIDGKSRG